MGGGGEKESKGKEITPMISKRNDNRNETIFQVKWKLCVFRCTWSKADGKDQSTLVTRRGR